MQIGVKMKRNTAELKEKLITTGIEEIRIRGIDPNGGSKMRDHPWSTL